MFFKILNKIKNQNKNNKLIITLNKNELVFVKKLIKLNIIKYVFTYKYKYVLVLNFFKKNQLIFKLKNMYKTSNLKKLKLKNLKKINKKNAIFLLTTNKGVVDNFEACKFNTGGVILNYIWN